MNNEFLAKYGPVYVAWVRSCLEILLMVTESNITNLECSCCPSYIYNPGKVVLTSGGREVKSAYLGFEFFSDESLDIMQGSPKEIFIARLDVSPEKLVKFDTFVNVTFGGITSEPISVPVP